MSSTTAPFLFVGTAKAGTTSIYNYLLQHPDLYIPKKETFYFLRDIYQDQRLDYPQQRAAETMVLDTARYRDLHKPHEDQIHGEIGTGYLFHHEQAIPRILEELGVDTRILIILRDPVERAFSSYNHFVKDMHEPLDFEASLKAEEQRAQMKWDFMWQHRALGLYHNQVKAYMDSFKHVKVLLYDELKADPDNLMKEVFEFIGAEPLEDLDTGKQFNPSGEPRSKTIQKLLIHENPLKRMLRPIVRGLMSDERRERMRKELKSRNLKEYSPISEETEKELRAYYAKDIEKLARLTGLDLSNWR